MNYFEYGEIRFDGHVKCSGARKYEVEVIKHKANYTDKELLNDYKNGMKYDLGIVRYKDHILTIINNKYGTIRIIMALPDSARFSYARLTGEYCRISNVAFYKAPTVIKSDYIPRIIEAVTYIDGPVGDIPNLQVDGWCSDHTEAFPVEGKIKVKFHTRSLPTARLIWHCPYIKLFYSDDMTVNGPNYREFVVVRIDGENWESDEMADNDIIIQKDDEFDGWDKWKEVNKTGLDCEIDLERTGNQVVVSTKNFGIIIKSKTMINDNIPAIYATLTGDQIALTDIHIERK